MEGETVIVRPGTVTAATVMQAEWERKLAASTAEINRLRVALRDALDFADEGWSYAPAYFRDKWGYDEQSKELRAALGCETKR